jgi:hypothetical protein
VSPPQAHTRFWSGGRRRGSRIGQVSFDGYRLAAVRPDLGGNGLSILPPVITVGLGRARIGRILDLQEDAQHRTPSPRQRHRSGRPNAMISARHDRRVRARRPVSHHIRPPLSIAAT